ncbi:MAG: FAD-dependent oxidoreductase [Phycisphaeraceae bacterium]
MIGRATPLPPTAATRPVAAATATFDVVVIGAGPAGAFAACLLARRGASVLLLDKARFPRDKACGGCVSAAALQTLARHDLSDIAEACGAVTTDRLHLCNSGRAATIPLPPGRAISRRQFDQALVDAARAEGALFYDGTAGRVAGPASPDAATIGVHLAGRGAAHARMVLVADGLAGGALRGGPRLDPRHRPAPRVGLGAVLATDNGAVSAGTIHMAVAPCGYVGLVRLDRDQLGIAAAVDPRCLHRRAGEADRQQAARDVIAEIAHSAGLALPPATRHAAYLHTPYLTRQVAGVAGAGVAGHRVLRLGDAAGYAEPFTGHGIAWALRCAELAVEPTLRGLDRWPAGLAHDWSEQHRRTIRPAHRQTLRVTRALRSPALTGAAMRVLAWHPRVAGLVVRHYLRERR